MTTPEEKERLYRIERIAGRALFEIANADGRSAGQLRAAAQAAYDELLAAKADEPEPCGHEWRTRMGVRVCRLCDQEEFPP